MKNTMEYKKYVGSIEFSAEDMIFYGKVLGVQALISYEGADAESLVEDFHAAVDDYLATCKANDITPETAYKGSFNVRIPAELHKRAAIAAISKNCTLNRFVEDAISSAVDAHS